MKRLNRTLLIAVAILIGSIFTQLPVYAKPGNPDASAAFNAIVGLWDVEVNIFDCNTGAPGASFLALHKFEVGGTGQVVPATNPAGLSAHMLVWQHVSGGDYLTSIKMFRFDGSGNYIGWIELNNEVSINAAADEYEGSGVATIYNAAGIAIATSCPSLSGTRYTGDF